MLSKQEPLLNFIKTRLHFYVANNKKVEEIPVCPECQYKILKELDHLVYSFYVNITNGESFSLYGRKFGVWLDRPCWVCAELGYVSTEDMMHDYLNGHSFYRDELVKRFK